MSRQQEDGTSRRNFLKLAGTAAPAAAAAVVVGADSAEAAAPPVDETRIQDTEHTRAYLDSARF